MSTETSDGSAGETESLADDAGSTDDAPLTGDSASESETATDESGERFDDFTRSVFVTTTATMLGVVAGIASMLFATTEVGSTVEPDNLVGVAILVGAVAAQFPIYSIAGLEPDEFDTKTQLYVFAMTFFTWFITWSVLLTTNGLL